MYFGPLVRTSTDSNVYTGKRYVPGAIDSTSMKLNAIVQESTTGVIQLDVPYTKPAGNMVDVSLYGLWPFGQKYAFSLITSRITSDTWTKIMSYSPAQMLPYLWNSPNKNFYLASLNSSDYTLTYVLTSTCLRNIPPGTFIFSMTKVADPDVTNAYNLVQDNPPQSALMYFTGSSMISQAPPLPTTNFTRPVSTTAPTKVAVSNPTTRLAAGPTARTAPPTVNRIRPVPVGGTSNNTPPAPTLGWGPILGLVLFGLLFLAAFITLVVYLSRKQNCVKECPPGVSAKEIPLTSPAGSTSAAYVATTKDQPPPATLGAAASGSAPR